MKTEILASLFGLFLTLVLNPNNRDNLLVNQPKEFPHVEVIKREFTLDKTGHGFLFLANVSGDIQVEGYDGNKIVLELKKSINSASKKETLKGIDDIQLRTLQEGNAVFVYMESPYGSFDRKNVSYGYQNECNGKSCYAYTFRLDYKIKVPKSMELRLQTVDKGAILINKIESTHIQAFNVVGSISLQNVAVAVEAKTVEGDIFIDFLHAPPAQCSFATVNGNINASIPKDLDGTISYQIRKGRFKNDFLKSKNIHSTTDFIKGDFKLGNGSIPINFNLISGTIEIRAK